MEPFPSWPVVSAKDARARRYPYVYVEADGSVRELHAGEREYLETPFPPDDGGRPSTKSSFTSKNGWGSLQGFCSRKFLPWFKKVGPAPQENPHPLLTDKKDIVAALRKRGIELDEKADGTYVTKGKPKDG